MKKIEIFKRRLIFKIEKKEEEEREYDYNPEEILGEKIIYLIVMLSVLVISSKLYLLAPTLKEGDVVTKDIIAPRTLKYNDRIAKENLVNSIIEDSEKQYIYVPEAEKLSYDKVNNFYTVITHLKNNKIDLNKAYENFNITIPRSVFEAFIELDSDQLELSKVKVLNTSQKLYEAGYVKKNELKDSSATVSKIEDNEGLTSDEALLISYLLQPNYIFDEDSTKGLITQKVDQLDDVIVEIKAGTLIAGKGVILDKGQVAILRAYGIRSFQDNILKVLSYFIYLIGLSITFYLVVKKFLAKEILNKNLYRSSFLIMFVSFLAIRLTNVSVVYLLPIDAMFFLLGILVNPKYAAIMGSFFLVYAMPLIDFDFVYYISNTLTFLLGLYLLGSINNRTSLINAGMKMGISKLIIVFFIDVLISEEIIKSILDGGSVLLSGVFSGMLTIALLPYFERTFNILTIFKLLELGDLSNPLLKKLSVNTPGTFHHSMMVATLSENAAEAIGANAIFARVAAYYHDIGKMKRPNFYVENQQGKENPHNKLSPTMSNLIILSHTKDGVEMGKEYGIPKEIRDIMIEHQGTTLLAYFYNKAKQNSESVEESDFRYSGPKPRTKESAIIMLADSIEAAVRSLDTKTPITIEKMIRKIISGKIEDDQLSEADLTFKEIEIIIQNFTKVLMGIHHIRLKYPGQKN